MSRVIESTESCMVSAASNWAYAVNSTDNSSSNVHVDKKETISERREIDISAAA